jgi:hypothetical protein
VNPYSAIIEYVGGPADGEVTAVMASEAGVPPPDLNMMQPRGVELIRLTDAPGAIVKNSIYCYRRVGQRADGIWLYSYYGEQ